MKTLELLQERLQSARLSTPARQLRMALRFPEHARDYLNRALAALHCAEEVTELIDQRVDTKSLKRTAKDARLIVEKELEALRKTGT